jgi:integrase
MVKGIKASDAYTVHMGGIRGNPPGRVRPRGNIEERAGGALRVRVYAGVDVLTGRPHYLKQTIPAGPNACTVAERARDELIRQVEQGRAPRTNATVSQLLDEHLKHADLGQRTRQSLQGYARKHVHPLRIGTSTISEVGVQLLETFYAELRRCRDHCDSRTEIRHYTTGEHRCTRRCRKHQCRGLGDATIRKIHFLLSAAWETAMRWGWVSVNPTTGAKIPPAPRPHPRPPTADQAAALVTECWQWCSTLGAYVWLAMTTGARRGELCALRWGDLQAIHSQRGTHDCIAAGCRWVLAVERAIAQSADEREVWEKDTKTHQQRRVALDPETVAVFSEHRQRCDQAAQAAGATITDECFMFASTPDGTGPCKPSSMSNRYKLRADKLGIKTSLKSLRHYSATELITAGVDIRTVAGRLGHSGGGTTTLKVYAAWVAAADQLASTVLMNRMPQRPASPADPAERARTHPRYPYEQLAAVLYQRWQTGGLAAGSTLTATGIATAEGVAVGTAHRVMTLLQQWDVLTITNGGHRPSIVRDRPSPVGVMAPAGDSSHQQAALPAVRVPTAESTAPHTDAMPGPVLLELVHLGTRIRSLTARVDLTDFAVLENLLRSAIRRSGGDLNRVDDYELAVHIPGQTEPVTTVVVTA